MARKRAFPMEHKEAGTAKPSVGRDPVSESEENFRSLAENANDGILIASGQGVHVYANRRASEITGYTVEELLATTIKDLVHPEESTIIKERYKRRLRGEDAPKHYTTRIIRKDGQTIPIEITASKTIWRGEPSAMVILRDITDRLKLEEALRQKEGRYRDLYEHLRDGSAAVDMAGRILEFNPAFQELLGYEAQEIFQLTYKDITPEKWHPIEQNILDEQVVKRGFSDPYEKEYIRKDGTAFPVELRTYLIRDRAGNPAGMWAIVRDVTQRRQMEEELLKTQKLESLGILAGGIAHDFNNFLTVILANISMARIYGNLQDDPSKMLADAEQATLRAKNLTQQLLAFAKGGAPVRKITSLSQLVREHVAFALSGSKVRCEYSIPESLWLVEIDEGQIAQVIHNLIINADQAMAEGGTIQILAKNVIIGPEKPIPLKDGRYVLMSIHDQGIGIPTKHLHRIFDPFFTTKQKGSGLGLTTSFSIVRNHEGYILVDSVVGEGTTFHVYLPASDRSFQSDTAEKGTPVRGEGRILVIDDDEMIRRSAGKVLTQIGYKVEGAADGVEGLLLYRKAMEEKRPFALVIMDLTIPGGMGGREAVKRLRAIDPHAKVIASSGYSNDPVMANFKEYGFTDVVLKPYRIEDLARALQKALKG